MPETCAYKMLVYRTSIEMGSDPQYSKASENPVETVIPAMDTVTLEKRMHKLLHDEIDRFLIADFEAAREDEELPGDQYDGFVIAACVNGKKPEIRVIADAHDTPLYDEDQYEDLKSDIAERRR